MTGEEVRRGREKLGWSQQRLSRATNLPLSAILILERLGLADQSELARVASAIESALSERMQRRSE